MSEERKTNDTSDDELVNVSLPRRDVKRLKEIIDRDRSLSTVGKYARNVLLVAAGGLITLVAAWDTLKRLLLGGS